MVSVIVKNFLVRLQINTKYRYEDKFFFHFCWLLLVIRFD